MTLKRWSLPLAFIAGLIFGLAHAPFNLPWLAIFGLPLAAWLSSMTTHKLWAGYLFGLGFFVLTMSWISEPFAVGPQAYAWMGYPAWALMAAGLALFWIPLFAFTQRGVWTVALMFGAVEYLRGHIFTGLPWALLAYGWQDSWLASFAAIIGSYGLSALIALVAVLGVNGRNWTQRGIAIAILLPMIAFHFVRPMPTDTSLAAYDVRVVQPNFAQDERWEPSLARAQLDTLIELSQGEVDLVVWPEGSTFISPSDTPELLPLLSAQIDAQTLIFGAPTYENGNYFNSAYDVQDSGQFYRYDKQHLVPFGEYIPFGDWLLSKGIAAQTVNMFSARKGKDHPYPDLQGPRPNILICYEGIFPKMSRRDGDFLVLITNDIWFGQRSGPYQHLAAARFRAIENGQPLVRSALTGISAIINADGEVMQSIPLNQQGSLQGVLGAKYASTPYRQLGDWPFLIFSVLGLGCLVASGRKKS